MTEKYVEQNDTEFINQYELKENLKDFVTDKQSAVTSYNTGVTLDCHDVLFSNYDIFDSTTIKDEIKYAYKGVGTINGNYPIKEYPYIYASNYSKVIGNMPNGTLKDFFSRDKIFTELFVPYYEVIKTIDVKKNTISYDYEYIGNLFKLMDKTSSTTSEYNGVTFENYHKKDIKSIVSENNDSGEPIYTNYKFSYYSNDINNENQLYENNKFNEYGTYLIVNSQKIDMTDFFIDVHKEHFMFMERDSRYDIGSNYYAWVYDNKEVDSTKYKLCTESIDKNGEVIFSSNTSCVDESYYKKYTDSTESYGTKIKDSELIFYTDDEIITNTTNILLIACRQSGSTIYDLYSSQFNNNINLHNFFLKNSNTSNNDIIRLFDNIYLKYDEKTNLLKHTFSEISFTMFQNLNKTFKDSDNTIQYEQNIFGYFIEYKYNGIQYTLYLNNYELERFLLTNTSIRIIGNSIYISNVIGKEKKSNYQIRFDNIQEVNFKTITKNENYHNKYIYKNVDGTITYIGKLNNNIQIIK